jgi:putative drug exporter of the RND superfamily
MFALLGRLVARGWLVWLFGWAIVCGILVAYAPPLASVTRPGEFDFLPSDVPSRRGAQLFDRAFPGAGSGSSAVLVVYREFEKLRPEDHQFVENELAPRLESLAATNSNPPAAKNAATGDADSSEALVALVRTAADKGMGPLLNSNDGRATLVVLELRTDFLSSRGAPIIAKVDDTIAELRRSHRIPEGLKIAETGSAVVGRDLGAAREQSAQQISFWTIALVIGLLLLVYRAPLLALVPLLTLYVAFNVFLRLLTLGAQKAGIGLFQGIDVYTTVLAYGVGVDYTLFLISRYREELATGADRKRAVVNTLSQVGSAVAASAATGILGIGMMVFASFGKLHQAGFSIALSLFAMLCAALTLTPALLQLGGRWIFWPHIPQSTNRAKAAESTALIDRPDSIPAKGPAIGLFDALWHWTAQAVVRRPATLWLVTFAVLAPFAIGAIVNYNRLDFGLITDLPRDAPSVTGTAVICDHFPAGETGPVTLLIENPKADFSDADTIDQIDTLSQRLMSQKDQLQIADIRSVAHPLGTTPEAEQLVSSSAAEGITARAAIRQRERRHYVGEGDNGEHVTRLDVVLATDPFARQSIPVLDRLEQAIRTNLPKELAASTIDPVGPTASVRDLKTIADHDRTLINVLVVAAVLVVLLVMRLGLGLSLYLVATVVFSYLASLGVTFAVFWSLDREGFAGLTWTVPLFLFTVLVAVGIDYNIFLLSRVREETERSGPIEGVSHGLDRTGTIISSCGIIMAGTFCSLLVGGRLAEMQQLGFALAFGIFLDTFVVRPLLVPTFLVLVRKSRLGAHFGAPNRLQIRRQASTLP